MSSEEKRIKTRKDIMENESIFTSLKSNSPSSASTVANNSTKAKKIESFRKVTAAHIFCMVSNPRIMKTFNLFFN